MKKTLIIISLVCLTLSLFIHFFKPAAIPQKQPPKSSEQILNTNHVQTEEKKQLEQNTVEPKLKKLTSVSEEAATYYKMAYKYGWESIVHDFENGMIAKSKMTDKEKIKLCEIALSSTNLDQTKRLFAVNCKPTNGKISFFLINKKLTKENGQIDQAAIIEKLRFFKAENVLQTETVYQIGPYKEKSNLQTLAVAWGLEDVSDYLLSIGVNYHNTDSNLILDNVSGHHPTASMIQKLLDAGIEPNKKVFELMQEKEFSSKHPEIYQLLQKNAP